MKKIFIRSPYFIEIDEAGQTGAKIEIFLWNKGTTEPTTPNYTLTKNIASASQTLISWNVANYAKEFIKPIAPVSVSVPTEENVNTWCYMKIKTYKLVTSTETLLNTETFVCLNGYTQYSGGYNQSTTDEVVPLVNPDIKIYKTNESAYVNVFFDEDLSGILWYDGIVTGFDFNTTDFSLYKLPIITGSNWQLDYTLYQFTFNVQEICEPKYTPITCKFINRFGGWQFLTFFKANSSSIDVTSKDFNMLPKSINYNVLQGQKRVFNSQGKQKIKCNTGWVDENYFELIQDLLLSETVLLDNKPVIVKSQSSEYKTNLKDKNINYEIEFEYNFGLINDVI
jgi:hypothetical protein